MGWWSRASSAASTLRYCTDRERRDGHRLDGLGHAAAAWAARAARAAVVVARERQRRIEGGCRPGGRRCLRRGAWLRGVAPSGRRFFPFDRGYSGVRGVVVPGGAFLPSGGLDRSRGG